MGIKPVKNLLLILFFALSLLSFGLLGSGIGPVLHRLPRSSTSGLPDKIFAFTSPNDTLVLPNLYFDQYFTYYIYVEIVTPHNCSLEITLWDMDLNQYNVFEGYLYLEPESGRYYDIPFGTAFAGNYTLEFSTTSIYNVNLYIRIERGPRCLFDKIPMEEYDGIRFYEVTRFSDGMSINHTITLKSDCLYKFYMERVSAISYSEDNDIRMNYSLYDPNNLEYSIHLDEVLVPITEIDIIKFGTAVEGEYTISISIDSEVEYSNIAYSITELYKISDEVDPNQSNPTNSTGNPTFTVSIPKEWMVGFTVFFGAIIIGLVLMIRQRRDRNAGRLKDRPIKK
ncbi:MAG: hypothetical protein ACFFE4_01610 [Candidatus Thorarchaeota archaeon]